MCKSRQWFCKCCKRIIDKEYFTECHKGKDSCTRKFVFPKFDKKCSTCLEQEHWLSCNQVFRRLPRYWIQNTDEFPIAFLVVGNFAHAVTNKKRLLRI